MELITIEQELEKNPQLKREDLKALREWIAQEETAPQSISDVQLALFLHCCDYDLETTKKTIKINYRWRAEQPDYFTNRSPKLDSNLAISMDTASFLVLPRRSSAGELILVVRIIDNDPKLFHCMEAFKLFFMFMDMHLAHHGTSNGVVILYDCEPVTFALIRKVHMASVKALFFYLQEAVQFKVNAIHYMNSHAAFDFLFKMFKPFVKGSLMEKLHFHRPESTTIFAHLAPNSVPKFFNGEEETSLMQLHEKSKEQFLAFEPWFESEENELAEFTKTLNLSKPEEDDFDEPTGSFRKLDFD